jgi:hypothetical protein
MRNLTASDKASHVGDTLRLQIEKLRPDAVMPDGRMSRTQIGRLAGMLAGNVSRHIIYNWYKRHVKLSAEDEGALKDVMAKAQAEDAERVEAEEAEAAKMAERRERRKKTRRGGVSDTVAGAVEFADPDCEELEEVSAADFAEFQRQIRRRFRMKTV